ncbi:N-6 DNA methylase [Nocardia lasii]|uniref:N-6 DNA methylase n=1 Tax=Nocardia lasii TaxID=1616107 RepID=A0ABW1JPF2_9NOCA
MTNDHRPTSQFVNRAELADLLRVDKSTFKVWGNRHGDFPAPVGTDERGAHFYEFEPMQRWLDHRKVLASKLIDDESVGTTYGDRLRRRMVAHRTHTSTTAATVSATPAEERADADALLAQLRLWPRSSSNRGGVAIAGLAIAFLNTADPTAFQSIPHARQGVPLPRLWSMVTDRLDKAGQRQGISAHLSSELRTMRPPSIQNLLTVAGIAAGLGPHAAQRLVEQFDMQAELGPTRYVAPASVSHLMAGCAVGAATDRRVTLYDPNIRGGEILHAVLERLGPHVDVTIDARAADQDLAQLAGLSLATTGSRTTISAATSPWSQLNRRFASSVVTNPPFNDRLDPSTQDLPWPYGTPPLHNGNYAWLQLAASVLEPGGFASVLMPAKAGQSSNADERKIRTAMARAGVVHAVISLPDKLFRPTDLPATIWVLRSPSTSPAPIRFVDARNAGELTATGRRCLPRNVVDDIVGYVTADSNERVGTPDASWQGIAVAKEQIEQFDGALEPALYLQPKTMPAPKELLAQTRRVQQQVLTAIDAARTTGARLAALDFQPSLPANWKTKPLSHLCDLQSGPPPAKLKAANRDPSGVPVISNKHLNDGIIVHTETDGVREDIAGRMGRYRVATNDVLVVRTGSLGRPAIVGADHRNYLLGSNLVRLRPYDPDQLDPSFLRIVLGSSEVLAWMRSHSAGTVVHSLGADQLQKLTVVVPPITDQRAIVSAIQVIDEQIRTLNRALDAARDARDHLTDGMLSGAVGVSV